MRQVIKALGASEDPYFRERTADIRDISHRVFVKLCNREHLSLDSLEFESVVIAHELAPSDTASMPVDKVLGFVTDVGGRTSHVAIIAKALEIPAVVGLQISHEQIEPGDIVIVDGGRGLVYVDPDENTKARYLLEQERLIELEKGLLPLKDLPAQTIDGRRIEVFANIELPDEVESVLAHGAMGIGLYRTEFLYLTKQRPPTEQEQYEAYTRITNRMFPHPVVFRTIDLGGDKLSDQTSGIPENNPFLGYRAIRFSLERKDIFRVQLRAILRASAIGNARIMFPLISSLEELIEAKEVLDDVKKELVSEGLPYDKDCPVGIMIEVPSAALMADRLAEEADFFSIGTNDLIQYTLAVDRSNEKVASLFVPWHPAVLRLVEDVVTAGHEKGIHVAMCGEMSADPLATIFLVGVGLDELSMSPTTVPKIKNIVRSIKWDEAREVAKQVLTLKGRNEIKKYLEDALKEKVMDLSMSVDTPYSGGQN